MVKAYLNDLKKQKNLSWQEISDLSNIPQQTIRNVFSGETPNPGINTIIPIVVAMDGSPDEMAGIARPAAPQKSSFEVMSENYEARLSSDKQSHEERVSSTKASYENRILQLNSSHERQIEQLTESNERRIRELNESFERRIKELNDGFERRMAEGAIREDSQNVRSDRRFYAMLILLAMMLGIIVYLFIDALHGNWGIFQYQEMLASAGHTGFGSGIAGIFHL